MGVGGYYKEQADIERPNTAQFQVEDERTPEELIHNLCCSGYIPSYCTACYRSGRTGTFMALAKTGQIVNVCQPNAILTFKEYLEDYAGPENRALGEKVIEEHLQQIKNEKVKAKTREYLELIEKGQRDFYF